MTSAAEIAQGLVGTREGQAALGDYLKTGGQNLDPVTTAWCAAFVNASVNRAGGKGTGSNAARSFLNWGQGVDKPQVGDVAVFSRGDPNGPYGHVGFFQGYNSDGSIRVLGGNQSDSVSVSSQDPSRLLGFRRGDGSAAGGDTSLGSTLAGGVNPSPELAAALTQARQPSPTLMPVTDAAPSQRGGLVGEGSAGAPTEQVADPGIPPLETAALLKAPLANTPTALPPQALASLFKVKDIGTAAPLSTRRF